jgi:hypothetical protein
MGSAGIEPKLRTARGGTPRIEPGDHCVLGVLVTARSGNEIIADGLGPALTLLDELPRRTTGALYFYYAPDPGQRHDPEQAAALFARLRDAAVGCVSSTTVPGSG